MIIIQRYSTKFWVTAFYCLANSRFFRCYNWVGFMIQVKASGQANSMRFLKCKSTVTRNPLGSPALFTKSVEAMTVILLFISSRAQTHFFSFHQSPTYNLSSMIPGGGVKSALPIRNPRWIDRFPPGEWMSKLVWAKGQSVFMVC